MKSLVLRVLVLLAALLLAGNSLFSANQPKNGKTATPLPQECADADFDQLGNPVMVEVGNGLLLGLSVGTKRIMYGDQVPLYFWMVNPTNNPQFLASCHLQAFRDEGFDIYDANQERVLSKYERENPQFRRPSKFSLALLGCSMNAFFKYEAHSCSQPYADDLRESYDLKPGRYVLTVPLEISYVEISYASTLKESEPVKIWMPLEESEPVKIPMRLEKPEPVEIPIGRILIVIEPK